MDRENPPAVPEKRRCFPVKKSTKALLIAAFCCVLAGLSFCIASFFFGISQRGMTDVIQQGRVQLEEKLGWFRDIGTDLSKSEKQETEFSETYANVTELDLELGDTNCTLIPWQGVEWKVSGSLLPAGFSCRQDGRKLKIKSVFCCLKYYTAAADTNGAFCALFFRARSDFAVGK